MSKEKLEHLKSIQALLISQYSHEQWQQSYKLLEIFWKYLHKKNNNHDNETFKIIRSTRIILRLLG